MRTQLTRPGEYSRKRTAHHTCQNPLHSRSMAPRQGKNKPCSARDVVGDHAGNHDGKVAGVEPKELFPGVFRPPMLPHLLHEAAAEQRFINHVNDLCRDPEPEREDQRYAHANTPARDYDARKVWKAGRGVWLACAAGLLHARRSRRVEARRDLNAGGGRVGRIGGASRLRQRRCRVHVEGGVVDELPIVVVVLLIDDADGFFLAGAGHTYDRSAAELLPAAKR